VIDLLAAATAALSHAFVNAVVLFVKLVAVSTVIALAIATASGEGDERQYVGMPMERPRRLFHRVRPVN
jgi:hypothetical protein